MDKPTDGSDKPDPLAGLGLASAEDVPATPPAVPLTPAPTPPASAAVPADGDDDEEIEVPEGAENPDAVRNAIKAERKAAREANARARELESQLKARDDAQKPLEQQLAEAQENAEKAALAALRLQVAADAGIDLKLASRLQGTTLEELTADAETFKTAIGTPAAAPAAPPEGGFRQPAPEKKDPVSEHNALLTAILGNSQAARTGADPLAGLQPAPEDDE
jgi:hypothetical protein